uniref:Uncharacterized protein n=1 Tax=Oryza nivara TaxID=4536 RepID=A0A0E0FZV0_ORYNI
MAASAGVATAAALAGAAVAAERIPAAWRRIRRRPPRGGRIGGLPPLGQRLDDAGGQPTTSSLATAFLCAHCATTRYPDICYDSLLPYASTSVAGGEAGSVAGDRGWWWRRRRRRASSKAAASAVAVLTAARLGARTRKSIFACGCVTRTKKSGFSQTHPSRRVEAPHAKIYSIRTEKSFM